MLELAARMIDPAALALVAGGSAGVAMLRSTRDDLSRALGALRPLLRAVPERDALGARGAILAVERLTELKGTACADRVEASNDFVRKAALKLADAPTAEAFSDWGRLELEERSRRHAAAAAVWRVAADAAPSMGMIGTVLGLIAMFAEMDDPERLGPAMALAMLTTLYGLFLGSIVFGSVAGRLERLSEAELAWQKAALQRLEKLARGEPSTTGAWLKRRSKAPGE